MKRIFTIIFFFITGVLLCQSQWVVDTLANVPSVSMQEVTFLSEAPTIDGVLDENLESLFVRQFGVISKFKKDNVIPISYRIAYGTEFFYLFI